MTERTEAMTVSDLNILVQDLRNTNEDYYLRLNQSKDEVKRLNDVLYEKEIVIKHLKERLAQEMLTTSL